MIDTTTDQLLADAAAVSAHAFWTRVREIRPDEPEPKAVPHLWRYADMRPLLERARELVVGEGAAERRVFILTNPAMDPRYTTDGVAAALQLILPGEIATSHRHTASAIRFVVEGRGAYTQVGGERIHMRKGDLVLTPSRRYHDHGNESGEPMVWLDALDLPLFHLLPANFSNDYREPQYPAEDAPESDLVYHWDDMQARLDAEPGTTATLEYQSPSGGPILTTLRASATRVDAGTETSPLRETASGVFHVVDGRGWTEVGDSILEWGPGDTFAVPAWRRNRHVAAEATSAYLFRIDEQPALASLGMYVTEDDLAREPR